MSIPETGLLQTFWLNSLHSIYSTPQATKFYKTLARYNNQSGDIFTKVMIIKCFEKYIDPKYVKATSEDIKKLNSEYDIDTQCKIFIGNMINDIYTKVSKEECHNFMHYCMQGDKVLMDNMDNIMCTSFITECIKTIKKEDLVNEIIKYINSLDNSKEELNFIHSGEELFNILIDIFTDMVFKSYEKYFKDIPLKELMNITDKLYGNLNNIYNYEPKYYDEDYDDDDNDDEDDDGDDGDGDVQPENPLKRKLDDDPTTNSKKQKFTL
jgi:hypothetical protein